MTRVAEKTPNTSDQGGTHLSINEVVRAKELAQKVLGMWRTRIGISK